MEPAKRKLAEEDEEQNPCSKISKITSEDRISHLPIALILHILSFATVKDAVKLCTLSRDWKSLWTSIPNLFFCIEPSQSVDDFASFVDKVLALYSAPKVKTFLLYFLFCYDVKAQIDSWFVFAATHEVEELFLNFRYPNLVYEWCWTFAWPSLKVLHLENVRLELDELRSIFLGSPLLEWLTLCECILSKCEDDCYMIDASDISLMEFTLDRCEIEYEHYEYYEEEVVSPKHKHIEIKGTNLLSLTVEGNMFSTGLKLGDLSSLIEANVCFDMEISSAREKKMIMSIIEKLHHVYRLVVGAQFFKVLSTIRLDREDFPPFACQNLTIIARIDEMYLHRMEVLLHSFPSLKQLTLNMENHNVCALINSMETEENHHFYRKNHAVEKNYWRSKIGSLKCLNQSLKKVEIIGLDASNQNLFQSLNLVEVAQFLLGNAKVLQKMIIRAHVHDMCRSSVHLEPKKLKNLLEIKEKLLRYPRASPDAVVVFETGRQ